MSGTRPGPPPAQPGDPQPGPSAPIPVSAPDHGPSPWFDAATPLTEFGPTEPNVARVYDHWLGGKDNFRIDRALGDQVQACAPWIVRGVKANRAFLARAVRQLADTGTDQFLDIGSGLPTRQNVHEFAHRVNPVCRVVYVDNDPIVLTHARALLATPPGAVVASGDLRDPAAILDHPTVRDHLDWTRPVAILATAVFHFLTDTDQPGAVLQTLADAAPPGSHLVISHTTPGDPTVHHGMTAAVRTYRDHVGPFTPRTPEQVADLLHGWQLLPPGLVEVTRWLAIGRAGRTSPVRDASRIPMTAGIAQRP